MDPQQQQQHQQAPQPQHMGQPPMQHEEPMMPGAYAFYTETPSYTMGYPQDLGAYGQVMHPDPPPRSLSQTDLTQFQQAQFRGMAMGLMPAHQLQYPQPMYQPQPEHVGLGLVGSPPASPSLYDPLSPPVSGSDTSGGEGIYHSRASSGAASPDLGSRRNSLSNRSARRYNPTPSPSSSVSGRRRGRSISDDDEGMGIAENIASSRKEVTRKQRIEAEQRRRDELRDGYAKLKDVLPVSNSKSSKVSLLDRATKYIVDLERENHELQSRLSALDEEVRRLRELNQKLSLSLGVPPAANNISSPGSSGMRGTATPNGGPSPSLGASPMSPPPEAKPAVHALTDVKGEDIPRENSSGSDDDF